MPGIGNKHRMTGVLRKRLWLQASAVVLVMQAPAWAQETIQLETVTVEGEGTGYGTNGFVAIRSQSATKTNTPLIETPQSISVVTSNQIEEQDARSIAAALRYTAGVGAEVTGGRDTRYGGFEIRGFDVTDEASFRDGLLMPYTAFANFAGLDPYGAERIDVIKGPASVLYGQGSPGGIINYVSKRPTDTPLREAVVEGGSFGRIEGRFDLSDKLSEDGTWRYRVTGLGRTSDSEVDFVDDDRFFIAPVIEWKPDADTSLTILANFQRDRTGWGLQFLPYAGTVEDTVSGRRISRERFVGEPDFDRFDTDQASIGYQFETKATEQITLRQNVRYSYLHNEQELAYGGGWADEAAGVLNRYANDGNSHLHSFAVDNQAQAEFDTGTLSHTLVAGLDYRWTGYTDQSNNFFNDEDTFFTDPVNAFDPVYSGDLAFGNEGTNNRVRQNQTGLYLQDQIKIDRFSVLLGGRYDWVSLDGDDRLNDVESEVSDGNFSGRAALIYNFDNGIAPYVSYSESFLQPLDLNNDGEFFTPETGRQWEAGLKYQPVGFNGFFSVAVFDLVRDDVVRYGGPFGPTPTGQITSQGIELEGVVSVTDNIDLRAAYTYQDVEITDDPDESIVGNRPYSVPEQRASLWANYTFHDGLLDGFGVGGGVRYVGDSFTTNANTDVVPSYTVVDAALSYKRDNYDLSLNVSNLFDKEYVASCFDLNFGCFYGEGRRITGKAAFRW